MATERRAEVTWNGSLHGGQRHDRLDDERRDRRAARQLGGALEDETGGNDEPRGADRRGARGVLLDGALDRPRKAGNRRTS